MSKIGPLAMLVCVLLYFVPASGRESDALQNIALLGTAGSDGALQSWGGVASDVITTQLNDGETGWSPSTGYHSRGAKPSWAYIVWDEAYLVYRVVVYHSSYEAPSRVTRNFEIQTLKSGGKPAVDADWTRQGPPIKGNSSLVTTHAFEKPVKTRGVRIYSPDQALMLEEMQVFGKPASGAKLKRIKFAPPLIFIRHFPAAKFIDVEVDLRAEAALKRTAKAIVKVAPSGGKNILASGRIEKFDRVRQTLRIDTSTLSPGRYNVTAAVAIGGVTQAPITKELEILPEPEWLGNKVGVTEKVPAPWTPLEVDEKNASISCWGRRYEFKAPVGMSQIEILGKPLLAKPTRLIIRKGGKDVIAEPGGWKIRKATESKVSFTQSCRVAGVSVKAESWMEYDGFLWTKLSLKGPKVDGVTLELPVRPEMARVWCEAMWHPQNTTGLAPEKPTYFEPSMGVAHKVNFMRLGTEEHGIQWCRESLRGWHLADRKKGFGLIPRKDEYVMQWNFINRPTDLSKTVEIEYGWQALPARPRPKGWRSAYWGGGASRLDPPALLNYPEVYMYTERWNGRWNYWNNWSPEVFGADASTGAKIESLRRQFARNWSLRNEVMNLYCNIGAVEANSPEYRYYENDWTSDLQKRIDFNQVASYEKSIVGKVCPASESYRDFYVYYMEKSLRELTKGPNAPWYGLYFDVSEVWNCTNRSHGCDYRDASGWLGRTPVLGVRELIKRVFIASKEVDPRTFVTIHMSGLPWMAHWAFSDVIIEGEQFAAYWENKLKADEKLPADYTQLLTPEIMRAQFHSSLWGPQSMFLSEQWIWYARIKDWGRKPHPDREASMQHISGMLLVHDNLLWGNLHPDPWIQRALRLWGWDDEVEFLPYWNNRKYVKADAGGVSPVMVSLFKRPAGLMAVVMNDSDKDALVKMKFDFKALGLEDAGFFDVYDMGHPPLKRPGLGLGKDGSVKVTVSKRKYLLLQFIN